MRTGEFELPPGCSVTFDVAAVDVLEKLARIGAKSALEEFCRSYAAEQGDRPTAMQAWRAGHNPAAARSAHGGWFGLLDHLGLLSAEEADDLAHAARGAGRVRGRRRDEVVQARHAQGVAARRDAA